MAKVVKYNCTCCGNEKNENQFYKSTSLIFKHTQKMCICKDCLIDIYNLLYEQYENDKMTMYYFCQLFDVYFENSLFNSAKQQAFKQGSNLAQIYMQKVNSLRQYSGKNFQDGEKLIPDVIEEKSNENLNNNEAVITLDDKKNEEDVLRMLGYDPFESENNIDKRYLYNKLVDFLDENTLEDSFKLEAVIEIVKSFNQIDKINQALSVITSDIDRMSNNVGGVKSLIDAKNTMFRSVLALAKDNGISVNHNNNKSKGAGTLSGIIKKLQELGFEESEVNLFDIETCDGMKQVADISNKSIMQQLIFDENDYSEMIKEQRILIDKFREQAEKFEEENRLLKLKLKEVVG